MPSEDRSPGRLEGLADVAVVGVLLVVAALLRAGPLGPGSLWLDDAWASLVARAETPGDVLTVGLTAPGFAALLAGALALGGGDPLAAQVLPYAAGVVAVPGVFGVARLAGVPRAAALVGAAVLLTAPEHLTYSARVKQYTLEGLAVLAVTAAALLVLRAPARSRPWALLVLAAVAGTALSSIVAVPAAAAFGAAAVSTARLGLRRDPAFGAAARRGVAAAVGWGVFAAAWWVLVVAPATSEALATYWSDYFSLTGARGVLAGLSPLPVAVSGVAVACCAAVAVRRDAAQAVLLLGPLALAGGLAVAELAPLGGGRTDLYLYPSLCLLIAVGAGPVARLLDRARVATAAGALAVVALVAATPGPQPYPQEDTRPLVALLDGGARPGDVVLVYSASRWAHALYTRWPVDLVADSGSANGFTPAVTAPPAVGLVVLPPQRETPQGHRPVVTAATAGAERVWLLTSHTSPDAAVVADALAGQGLAPVSVERRPGAELSLWAPG